MIYLVVIAWPVIYIIIIYDTYNGMCNKRLFINTMFKIYKISIIGG